jgi:hypothetical protein
MEITALTGSDFDGIQQRAQQIASEEDDCFLEEKGQFVDCFSG